MQPLDLWTLFVTYVFGSFWLAIFGIAFLIVVIMAIFGRISAYTVIWYLVMFGMAMTLGYGFVTLNIAITLVLIIAIIFSFTKWIDSASK